jgi:hypothetical protein
MHDSKTYHDPLTFNPERFLGENPELDSRDVVFGFGRRICPGRLLADTTTYLIIAQSLAVFNIDKLVDENGHCQEEIDPSQYYQMPGLISHPMPFQTAITPRSRQCEKLIRAVETQHPWKESGAKAFEEIYRTKIRTI